MNHLDHLLKDWGPWNRSLSRLSIRKRGYRLTSMPDVLPAVDTISDLTKHENGALIWLEPRKSFENLQPPRVALGKDAAYVVDYYRREFKVREDRPFISYFRKPTLYGRHFSILDSKKNASKECIRLDRRWKAGVPRRKEEAERARYVPGVYLQACSEFHTHYAHHFCDILPRLKLYEDVGLLDKVPPLLHTYRQPFSDESFRVLGMEKGNFKRWDDTCWKLDGLYFAAPFKKFCSWTPESATWVRKKFNPDLEKKPPGRKIFYISRSAGPRALQNENEILEALSRFDITVVHPERISLHQQIDLFSDAAVIMGSQGAGIQNALWAPRGCKILEIVSPRYFSGVYWTLAQSLQQDYGLVTGVTEPNKNPIEAGVTGDPKLVLKALDALLCHR